MEHQQQEAYDDLGSLTEVRADVHGEQSGSLNYGERLYQKGMRRKEEMAKHIEILQQQKEQQDQYPFRPEICDRSRALAEAQGRQNPEYELLKFGDQVR